MSPARIRRRAQTARGRSSRLDASGVGAQLSGMTKRSPIELDMTPDGQFRSPPPPPRSGLPWLARIGLGAAVVAALAGLVAGAALALWLVSILLPVAILAAVIAWLAFRIQLWRLGGGSSRS
ncbi:MAG TPA: hypothetical protein VMI52_12680 [Acetobacteraceae bacterium]|nr:hypothetical protein [Acetobacteraceae bacterium]